MQTLTAQQPLNIVVTDSGLEVLALRNLLRHAAAALDPAKHWPQDEQEALAQHITGVLSGEEPNDYLVCGTCDKPPIACRCER